MARLDTTVDGQSVILSIFPITEITEIITTAIIRRTCGTFMLLL